MSSRCLEGRLSLNESEKISSPISKTKQDRSSEAVENGKPQLLIKFMEAKDLFERVRETSDGVETHGTHCSIHAQIKVGMSTQKTVSKKLGPCDDAVWGMLFEFDWDRSSRYARVELYDEGELLGSKDLLGIALIPLYTFIEDPKAGRHEVWYPLVQPHSGSRSSYATAKVLVQLSCNGLYPDKMQLSWQFMKEIQQLEGMTTRLLSRAKTDVDAIMRAIEGSGEKEEEKPYEGEERRKRMMVLEIRLALSMTRPSVKLSIYSTSIKMPRQ